MNIKSKFIFKGLSTKCEFLSWINQFMQPIMQFIIMYVGLQR